MANALMGVEYKEKPDGSWSAIHVPSGRVVHGLTKSESQEAMLQMLGFDEDGTNPEPLTSERFVGFAREIAEYLEGSVSTMLQLHSGYARLEAYHDGIAQIRLGGGCQGCPSSLMTLTNGVKSDLQHKFGEDVILDVMPVMD